MKTNSQPFRLAAIILALSAILPASCKKNDDKQVENTDVSITSFNPAEAAIGNTVVITGKHFSTDKANNVVKFNGTTATVSDAKTTELTVSVPEGASNGKITVTVNNKTATSVTDFKVNASAPQITGFDPVKGAAGVEVIITGQRFTNKSKAFFGTIPATTTTYVNATTLKAVVPADALTAKIRVTNDNLESLSATDFIAAPRITGLSADHAEEGEVITINGVNFGNNKENIEIGFGGILASPSDIESCTPTAITVKTPVAGKDGKIGVTANGLFVETANEFMYEATISDFSPKSGAKGTLVTLKGKRLGAAPSIEINGINAAITFRATDQTELRFNIPNHASVVGDKIKLKSRTLEFLTAEPFVVTNVWKKLRDNVAGQYYEKGFMYVQNNEIFVGLGKNAAGGLNNTYSKYSIANNTWSAPVAIPNTVTPRYDVSYARLGNRVFVIGGITSPNNYKRDVNYLDLGDGTWKNASPLYDNAGGGVAFVINNTLYAGLGNGATDRKISQFNNDDLTWTENTFTDILSAGYINSSCFVIDNNAYIGHGKDAANNMKKGFFMFTGNAGAIAPVADAKVSTDGAASFTYNGKGYVKAVHDLYEYNPTNNEWKLINSTDAIYVNYITVVNNRIFGIAYGGAVYEYIP